MIKDKKIVKYFDRLEDRIRGRLSRYPIIYTGIGGVAIVLFWRGVWMTADQIMKILPIQYAWLDGPLSVVISSFILLITGLFVSFFVTDKIIVSGIRQEKKLVEQAEVEIHKEADTLKIIKTEVHNIEDELKEIHDQLTKK